MVGSDCPKHGHKTKGKAVKHLKLYSKAEGMEVYQCRICTLFHIGHAQGRNTLVDFPDMEKVVVLPHD